MKEKLKDRIERLTVKESKIISIIVSIVSFILLCMITIFIVMFIDSEKQNIVLLIIILNFYISNLIYYEVYYKVLNCLEKEFHEEEKKNAYLYIKKNKLTSDYRKIETYYKVENMGDAISLIVEEMLDLDGKKESIDNIASLIFLAFCNENNINCFIKSEDNKLKLLVLNETQNILFEDYIGYSVLESLFGIK